MADHDVSRRSLSRLRTSLVGKVMLSFSSIGLVGPDPLVGSLIEDVEQDGRQVVISFDDGLVVTVGLRFRGAWHLYRAGQSWQGPSEQASVVIEVAEWTAVCYAAATVETHRIYDPRRHPVAGTSGPDVSIPGADVSRMIRRLAHHPDRELVVAEALLDARIVRGVSNALRSEILHQCGLSPFARLVDLAPGDREDLAVMTATMVSNARAATARSTVHLIAGSFQVYGRAHKQCHACGAVIESCRTGALDRPVFWCPRCQDRLDRRAVERGVPGWSEEVRRASSLATGSPAPRDQVG